MEDTVGAAVLEPDAAVRDAEAIVADAELAGGVARVEADAMAVEAEEQTEQAKAGEPAGDAAREEPAPVASVSAVPVRPVKLIDLSDPRVAPVLWLLLKDKSTGGNIIWATDSYLALGPGFADGEQITTRTLRRHPDVVRPRIEKTRAAQRSRTRVKAEVFTPAWLCNLMNNYADGERFGRRDVFTVTVDGDTYDSHSWEPNPDPVPFPNLSGESWRDYVDSRMLEITCGEAPFLTARYDVATGVLIDVARRAGFLDRKLRVVTENTTSREEWEEWALRALQACYGYEWQGDSLLIARINTLIDLCDHHKARWGEQPSMTFIRRAANVVAWNLWQMDGLKGTVPQGKMTTWQPLTLMDGLPDEEQARVTPTDAPSPAMRPVECRIRNWRSKTTITYNSLTSREKRRKKTMTDETPTQDDGEHAASSTDPRPKKDRGGKLFDFLISNPPYQEDFTAEGNKTYAAPVYHTYMDAVDEIATSVELIHPARFLFNAGGTPKAWNERMLHDPHFKVLEYHEDASEVFPNTDIKGGIAVTYHDERQDYGPIEIFTKYESLNSILSKVSKSSGVTTFSSIVANRGLYKFSPKAYEEHPEELARLADSRVSASCFERIPAMFTEDAPNDGNVYVQFLGLMHQKRVYRWLRRDYFNPVPSFDKYKVMFPAANGSGAFGEVMSSSVIGAPQTGHTETFMSIGAFDTKEEAEACQKYIKTKFCRAMLGILKITQHNSPEKWRYVPLQDFTSSSDIDWSQSVAGIDRQLYAKYGLSESEVDFIESHVQEMK